ncbi:MAG TPA: transporter [Pseudomonadota bacterium]|nr:transporter [Pseudomonadota bacterium]
MRSLLVVGLGPLWLPISLSGLLGVSGPGVVAAQTGPGGQLPAAGGQAAAASTKPTPTTTVRPSEDCAAVARRTYGQTPGALAHLKANNPGLCDKPLIFGATVRVPAMARKPAVRKAPPEPARLSYVGPAVRTKTRSGWIEALPGQPIDRRMSIQTSSVGGAEVNVQDKVKLQLEPNSKLVIKNLPRTGNQSGEVQLVDGTLHAGVTENPKTGPLTVRTKSAEIKLKGDARIDAAGDERTTLSVHEGSLSVKVKGTVMNIRAGQGTLILQGQGAQQPKTLPTAPSWSAGDKPTAAAEEASNRPFLVVAAGSLLSEQLKGEVEVDFAPVAGATLYSVEISRDPAFNDHRAGGEIKAPPLRAQLQPGRYYARVSAIDSERLVGPPSPVREFSVITLRTDASIVGVPVQNGGPPSEKQHGAQLMLVRSLSTMLELSGVGQPLQVAVDNATPVDCKSAHTFTLGPGEHHVHLRLADAESELLFSVAGPPPPAPVEYQARVEPIELPVPLVSPGFPGRSVQPRTRVYALLGLGSSLASRDVNVFRADIGGELALLQRRLSFDVNVPLLYYTGLGPPGGLPDDNAVAIGDVALGARAVPLKAASGRFLLGPMLRVQLPTGSFDRTATLGRPVTIDPALGMAAQLGRLGLQTTQGLPATVNLAQSQLRWAMSYSAEVKVWRLGLVATLDAAVGLLGPSESGASLGGGVRLQLGPWNLLTGVRGGLGDGGAAVFGRYYYFLGVEWSPL